MSGGTKMKKVKEIIALFVGNVIIAFCVAAFFAPHGIILGGATGISLLIGHFIEVETAVIVFNINILLFILGFLALGRKFALNTVVSTFLYPILLGVMQRIPGIEKMTENSVLAAVYSGALLGIGVGIIMRAGGSTGGLDIIALSVNKWFHIPVAAGVYCIDGLVLISQLVVSNTNQVLLGIFSLVLETVFLNRVIQAGKSQIQVLVISQKHEEIRREVLETLEAGVTMFYIETGRAGIQQKGVLCVIPQRKLYALKETVLKIDPTAFITVNQVNEVSGQGFTTERKYKAA